MEIDGSEYGYNQNVFDRKGNLFRFVCSLSIEQTKELIEDLENFEENLKPMISFSYNLGYADAKFREEKEAIRRKIRIFKRIYKKRIDDKVISYPESYYKLS